jgi:hypothetical protein
MVEIAHEDIRRNKRSAAADDNRKDDDADDALGERKSHGIYPYLNGFIRATNDGGTLIASGQSTGVDNGAVLAIGRIRRIL